MNTITEQPTCRQPAERTASENWLVPPVNIFELPDAYVVEAEMPGVNRQGLEVTLEGHTLTLRGRRQTTPPPGTPLYVESKPASFHRAFEVDPTIEAARISAQLEQGLLTVRLPKAERVKPRRIAVTD